MKPYIVDIVVAAIILFELLMGLRRGLGGEIFRLIGTCLVLAIGLRFYEDFGLMIANHSRLGQNQEMALALAFLLIVGGLSVCLALLRIVLTLIVTVKFNQAFDRPAGAVAGFFHGIVLAAIIVLAAGLWPGEQLQPLIKVDSYFGRTVFKFAPTAAEKIRRLCPGPRPSPDHRAPPPAEDKPDHPKSKPEQ